MSTPKFWPLDYDPEDEIYDSPAWDLPGYRKSLQKQKGRRLAQPPLKKQRTFL